MSEELLINHSKLESRVALLMGGITSEILIERHDNTSLVGNIYIGTVVRVLAGMQAAFVDIGEQRSAFLHASDMVGATELPLDKEPAPIERRLRQGERLMVQVIKDPLGNKGARLTTEISLPSRYLVYLPDIASSVGISQKIDNEDERTRLKTTLQALLQTVNLTGGLIARTAAEFVPADKLEQDIYYLWTLWRTVLARKQLAVGKKNAVLLYRELSLPLRCLRDLVNEKTSTIWVDDRQMFDTMTGFAKEFVPHIAHCIRHHTGDEPLFELYRVEEALQGALKRRVDLKSGGYLIIDQTEAMTTIDVNTGSFVNGRTPEDTAYKTNLEASLAIARQLRLRNLGGIIILDFIDMAEPAHREAVLDNLKNELTKDHAKTSITQVSELGLVEMTRKRIRESLPKQLCEPCSACQGRGFVKSSETVCLEIFRELMRCAKTYNAPKKFTVIAHANVIDRLLSSEADTVAELSELLGREIAFQAEGLYSQEQFDIILD